MFSVFVRTQRTGIGDAGLAHLGKVLTLKFVTDVGLAHLGKAHTLDLSFTEVTDAGLTRAQSTVGPCEFYAR